MGRTRGGIESDPIYEYTRWQMKRKNRLPKTITVQREPPGIAFEKMVAAIQAQIDPSSQVTHNEVLIDRLRHQRQFDIVIRGTFAGQQMLGVIECKDLKGKVGNPEVDAFVTKSQDINANFKILISRNGFSKPALEKCVHYGIQALSLLENDFVNKSFFIGTRWTADIVGWSQLSVTLHFADPTVGNVDFHANEITIGGKKVIDWFTNYLLDREPEIKEFGWVVDIGTAFDTPQMVEVKPGEQYLCLAIGFKAERTCQKLEHLAGISGTGFFNWNSQQATFAPGTTIRTDAVPMDFSQWNPRSDGSVRPTGFIEFHIEARSSHFERVLDAIKLETL